MRVLIAWVLLAGAAMAQDLTMFEAGSVAVGDVTYPFRLLQPIGERPTAGWPLVVFLHGAGERGTDNERQLTWLARPLAQAPLRERFPCLLLAVQCPPGAMWVERPWADRSSTPIADKPAPALQAVQQALATLLRRPDVDLDRVYLTGLSMGGYGSWELAMRMPGTFAAVLPVCGGGDERQAWQLLGLPIWAWHGASDKVVPPERSRYLVERLRLLGSDVRYDELAGVGHDSWKQAYAADAGLTWLFEQRRQPRPVTELGLRSFGTSQLTAPPAGLAAVTIGADDELQDLAVVASECWELVSGRPAPVSQRADAAVALRLDPQAPSTWLVEVADKIAIIGRDRRAVADGLAMALGLQALGTLGQRVHRSTDAVTHPGFVLSLQRASTAAALAPQIARWCWLCGIRRIELPGDVDAASWRQAAGVFGIEVVPFGTPFGGYPWEEPEALRWSGEPQRLPSLPSLSPWRPSSQKPTRIQVDLDPASLPWALPGRLLVVTRGVPPQQVPAFGRLFWPPQ